MIISLDFFIFNAQNIKKMKEQIKPYFSEFKPISSDSIYYNVYGVKETKVISGIYIADSNSKPEIIKQIVKKKKPVRLTLATGVSTKVLITNFTTDKKYFIPWSGAVKIDFQIEVVEVEEEFNIIGALYGLL